MTRIKIQLSWQTLGYLILKIGMLKVFLTNEHNWSTGENYERYIRISFENGHNIVRNRFYIYISSRLFVYRLNQLLKTNECSNQFIFDIPIYHIISLIIYVYSRKNHGLINYLGGICSFMRSQFNWIWDLSLIELRYQFNRVEISV